MKWWGVVSLALFVSLASPLTQEAAAAAKSSRIRPSAHAGELKLRVSGKTRGYHRATAAEPVEFRIRGPIAIRVLSRYLFAPESADSVAVYALRLEIDGVEVRTFDEVAPPSRKARRRDGGGRVGTLERTLVQIPAGSHKVRLAPTDEGAAVAVRLYRGSGRPSGIKWVSYAPETYEKACRLHVRDVEETYYRFSVDTPVTLQLHGPLQLKILSRLDFGIERGYTQAYALKAYIDGELAQTFTLKSRASHTAIYPELPAVTPGRGQTVYLDVPDGEHEITVSLDCTTAQAGSLRTLIPEKAVTQTR